ncbi:MAG TPA: hypothetical protein VEL70_05030 [Candidatus Acidoferrum sp.]|nr:hypothetical protein [Candidatus Acidoferrum sp.]
MTFQSRSSTITVFSSNLLLRSSRRGRALPIFGGWLSAPQPFGQAPDVKRTIRAIGYLSIDYWKLGFSINNHIFLLL